MTRLHIVDGTFELYRAFYSKRPSHRNPDGLDLKATLGLAGSMLMLLDEKDEAVTHLAVAFDNPIRSFRNDLFAGYKSDEGVPAELHAQFDLAEEALGALGITVWSMNEFEADDAIGTAAARWKGEVDQVRILSPDKDFGQCVDGERVVLVDRIREKVSNEADFRARRGISPSSLADWLALVGDDADGIPGIQGFGERTASTLLAVYEHIENIPASAKSWKPKLRGADVLAARLAAELSNALLYRTLATLRTDVPLVETLEDLRYRGTPRAEFNAFCDKVGARSLRDRPKLWR